MLTLLQLWPQDTRTINTPLSCVAMGARDRFQSRSALLSMAQLMHTTHLAMRNKDVILLIAYWGLQCFYTKKQEARMRAHVFAIQFS